MSRATHMLGNGYAHERKRRLPRSDLGGSRRVPRPRGSGCPLLWGLPGPALYGRSLPSAEAMEPTLDYLPSGTPGTLLASEMKPAKITHIVIGVRHRRDLGDIDSLARSITDVGLLHPIVIRPDGVLIAGARRLAACKALGWSEIPVRIMEPRHE
jgi:hypothetical protein